MCTLSESNFQFACYQLKSLIPAYFLCDDETCHCARFADRSRYLLSSYRRRSRSGDRCARVEAITGSVLRVKVEQSWLAASSFPCSTRALLVAASVRLFALLIGSRSHLDSTFCKHSNEIIFCIGTNFLLTHSWAAEKRASFWHPSWVAGICRASASHASP